MSTRSVGGSWFGVQGRARRAWGGVALTLVAVALVAAALMAGLGPSLLWVFAPELALLLAAVAVLLLCLPLVRYLVSRRGLA